MGISSVNPFALGNMARAQGASTYMPASVTSTKPADRNYEAKGFKGFASTEDIERASQYLQGNITPSSKVQKTNPERNNDNRGSLFEGFDVSNWQGSPIYNEGEKIYDYMA